MKMGLVALGMGVVQNAHPWKPKEGQKASHKDQGQAFSWLKFHGNGMGGSARVFIPSSGQFPTQGLHIPQDMLEHPFFVA